MILKNNLNIDKNNVYSNLKRITNQIYKLLPNREENLEWKIPLTTIIEELSGMNNLLLCGNDILFSILCKLEGLYFLTEPEDFFLYRRTIFECLNLISVLKEQIKQCQD